MIASFNRFELDLPESAVEDCSHAGKCDEDVEHWSNTINRPLDLTNEKLAAELKEYGAWNDEELADDAANWRRIIWIAAGNLRDDLAR